MLFPQLNIFYQTSMFLFLCYEKLLDKIEMYKPPCISHNNDRLSHNNDRLEIFNAIPDICINMSNLSYICVYLVYTFGLCDMKISRYSGIKDSYLSNTVYEPFKSRSRLFCATACQMSGHCHGFNYR